MHSVEMSYSQHVQDYKNPTLEVEWYTGLPSELGHTTHIHSAHGTVFAKLKYNCIAGNEIKMTKVYVLNCRAMQEH